MVAVKEADIGTAAIDGVQYVRIHCTCTDSEDIADLTFTLPAFVTFADHIGMIAEEIVSGHGV